ncbi:MAG: hypothetical protein AAF587_17765 [Bacteroidota bacterium]
MYTREKHSQQDRASTRRTSAENQDQSIGMHLPPPPLQFQSNPSPNPAPIQRLEFGNEVRLDSIPTWPPQVKVLGNYNDGAIAQELYGDGSVSISRVPGEQHLIQVDFDRLLSKWKPHFHDPSKEYPGAEGEKAFSDIEKIWITEVLEHPIISMVFDSYDSLPPLILNRVEKIGGSKGQYSSSIDEIALADKIYKQKETHHVNGSSFKESDEEAFKGTLIHEIFHYLEDNAESEVAEMPIPKNLIYGMLKPEELGLPAYAFGWFYHPKVEGYMHFQLPEVDNIFSNASIHDQPELLAAKEAGDWERSPMPVSGNSISPEEDLCESFSLALTSDRTIEVLRSKYPRRYQLLDHYIRLLQGLKEKAK